MKPIDRLKTVLAAYDRLTVAVSGGVDSLTLATVAGRQIEQFAVVHAISPAVPSEATKRVKMFALSEGWNLQVTSAGEFDDPKYLNNPINRCYYCKSNLYARIQDQTKGLIAAGTNIDDLSDFRPGLIAAKEKGIVHPFVEAGISKSDLREIAAELDLLDIAALPAQPCLSSRVETGLAITALDLSFIHEAELIAAAHLPGADVRCRVTHKGIRLELSQAAPDALGQEIGAICSAQNRTFLGIEPYRRGSAFVGVKA